MQNKRLQAGQKKKLRVGLLGAATLLLAPLLSACGSDNDDGVVLSFYTAADGAEQYAEAAANCSAASNGRVPGRAENSAQGCRRPATSVGPASDRQ